MKTHEIIFKDGGGKGKSGGKQRGKYSFDTSAQSMGTPF